MTKHKALFLILTSVCSLIGLVLMIIGIAIDKSFSALAILGLVLMIVGIFLLMMVLMIHKEVEVESYEQKKGDYCTCPHCGATNPSDIPYCTHCGCRLK